MDWIAAILIIYSIYLCGNKNKWGWIVAIVGAILFMIISIAKQIYGMVALDCVLVVMHLYNFFKWKKEENVLLNTGKSIQGVPLQNSN